MTAPVPTIAENLPYNDAVPGAVLEQDQDRPRRLPRPRAGPRALTSATNQGYDYCSMVTSIDWPQYFEVVYYLYGVGAAEGRARPARAADR